MFAFSDGGCKNNGKKNAIASFASIIIDDKSKKIIRGKVQPYEYKLIENKIEINENLSILPSNNRGELLGLIYCFLHLLEYQLWTAQKIDCQDKLLNLVVEPILEIEIISDSLISIKTLTKWLPDRRKKNTAHELKNFDLVSIAEILFQKLQEKCKNVKIIHVNSHQSEPNSSDPDFDKKHLLWKGNQAVDKHCGIALANLNYDVEII